MKVCAIQPPYSKDYDKSEEYFEKEIQLLKKCDASMDIIVMPEACDVPCFAKTEKDRTESVKKFNARIIEQAKKTAIDCNAIVFINAREKINDRFRNTTYAIDRKGKIAGKYYKEHLVPSSISHNEMDIDYSFEPDEPKIIEIDNIRFGFMTCYDFYFYEYFSNFNRYKPDIIIGCSHQRSDTHSAIELFTGFLAYNTNTYVIRSSVSMDENSDIGGASMIVAPTGKVLANMYSKTGLITADIDINKKYYKPAGFGNPDSPHYEYMEKGRRPWKYRPCGSAIVLPDEKMAYPRICAHRGFNTIAPENSMAAFGAAVAMGSEEIEFDLWQTKDNEIVSIHDKTLERISNGTGNIYDYTYEELLKYDFGIKYGEKFKGLKILRFEDILKKFSCHTIMNIHIKSINNKDCLDEEYLKKIVSLINKYDCSKYVYFMTGNDNVLDQLYKIAPDIPLCCGGGDDPWGIVERAIKHNCKKVQLKKDKFNKEMIDKAHANGIICNVFWADDVLCAKEYLDMGIDTILTNDYNSISQLTKNCAHKVRRPDKL